MNAEGGLVFDIHRDGNRVTDVNVVSRRPFQLIEMMRGKRPSDGLELLSLMYRVCGVAQRYAGLNALRHANLVEVSSIVRDTQKLLVDLETVREHLWQVLVIWPRLLDKPAPNRNLTLLSSMMSEAEKAIFVEGFGLSPQSKVAIDRAGLQSLLLRIQRLLEEHVFGMYMGDWNWIDSPQSLLDWARREKTTAASMVRFLIERHWQGVGYVPDHMQNGVKALPGLEDEELLTVFEGSARHGFVRQPTWRSECYETTPFTRQAGQPLVQALTTKYGAGLLTRMVARLVELSSLAQSTIQACELLFGWSGNNHEPTAAIRQSAHGLAVIEAGRGRLIHWLELQQGIINDYAIVAPTEWNFHPQGIAVQGLKTLDAGDEQVLRQQAALWIHAIDPCVSYELNIH